MKILSLKTIVFLSLWGILCGCGKDEIPGDNPDKEVADPTGTILVSMRNENNGKTAIAPKDAGSFYIDKADNFNGYGSYEFVTLGQMKGLGNVTRIPADGWASQVAVRPGYGYVAAYSGGNSVVFTRLYVDSHMTAVGGGIIGADVKYQSPFSGAATKISLSQTDITLEDKNVQGNVITISEPISYTLSSDVNWLSFSAKAASITVRASNNEEIGERNGVLTVSSQGMDPVKINVRQAGKKAVITVLDLPDNKINFNGLGSDTKSIRINTNAKWVASTADSWCSVSPVSGEVGNSTIQVKASANSSGAIRKTNVIIRSEDGKTEVTIPVEQDIWFSGGTGSAASPFQIRTAAELDLIRKDNRSEYHYELQNDIDLSSYLASSTAGWVPLVFTGSLHGNGKKITGLWISSQENSTGFIAYNNGNINVENLGIELGSKGIVGGQYTGGLIGQANYTVLINNCYVKGEIRSSAVSSVFTGGLIGGANYYTTITNSYTECTIKANATTMNVGGLIGNGYGLLTNCYVSGKLAQEAGYGNAIVKGIGGSQRTNCYFDSETTGATEEADCARTTEEMQQESTFVGWDFSEVWQMTSGGYPTLKLLTGK